MSSAESVCIVSTGARTPLGYAAAPSAAALRAAISAIGEHPYIVDKGGEPVCVAMGAGIDPEVDGPDRLWALLEPAIREACEVLKRVTSPPSSLPAFVGLPEIRPGTNAALHEEISGRLESLGIDGLPLTPVRTGMDGHAAGLMAMSQACERIREGAIEIAMVGGVDSYVDADTLEWLDDTERLMSARNPFGFPPGEGAGACILAAPRTAKRLGLAPLGWVVSATTALEKNLAGSDVPCTGDGLSEAARGAIAVLKLPEEKIHLHIDDMNGERYRTDELMYTVLRTAFAFESNSSSLHPSDCWGDVGAASGPLFTALAVESGRRGYAKGAHILLSTSSEGYHRAAAVIRVANTRRT